MSYKVYDNFVNYMVGLPEVFFFGMKDGRKRLRYFGAYYN